MTIMEERIAAIAALATEFFGGSARALRWLSAAEPSLGNKTPVSLLVTEYGFLQVRSFLNQSARSGRVAA